MTSLCMSPFGRGWVTTLFPFLALLLSTHSGWSEVKGIHGAEDRLDYYQQPDTALQQISESVAMIAFESDLEEADGGYRVDPSRTLESRGVCPDEPFAFQPSAGFATAFLVGPDLILTAADPISYDPISGFVVLFGYRAEGTTQFVTEFPAANVYSVSEVVVSRKKLDDWALLRLDRPVAGRSPLPFRTSGKTPDDQPLVAVGYPYGSPVKFAGNSIVVDNCANTFFIADLDTGREMRGSPVLNSYTLEVEGILSRTSRDLDNDYGDLCLRFHHCEIGGCTGEDVTRSTEWAQSVIDALGGSAPTATPTQLPGGPTPTPTHTADPAACPDDHGNDSSAATAITFNLVQSVHTDYRGDEDFFSFQGTAGTAYALILTPTVEIATGQLDLFAPDGVTLLDSMQDPVGVQGAYLVFAPTVTAQYFLRAFQTDPLVQGSTYNLRVLNEDAGNSAASATGILINVFTPGVINTGGDADFFRFTSVAGQRYVIETYGTAPPDTRIDLFDMNGSTILESNDDGGEGVTSRIVWTAPLAGDYFVQVRAKTPSEIGPYTLIVSTDDHGGGPETATPVTPGSPPFTGKIDYSFDQDVFSFQAQAGTDYSIELLPNAGLPYPEVTIFGPAWEILDGPSLDLYNEGLHLAIENAVGGTCYVHLAAGNLLDSGTYTLQIRQVTDLEGNTLGSAVPITVNSQSPGSIDFAGDVDLFRFPAQNGTAYLIEVELGTLEANQLYLYDGETLLLVPAFEHGFLIPGSKLIWIAPKNADFLVMVIHPSLSNLGTYTVHLTEQCSPGELAGFVPADIDADGEVSGKDLLNLLEDFGTIYPTPTPAPVRSLQK